MGPDAKTSDEEDGVVRPKKGHGRVGRGAPVVLEQGISARPFEDGAGLCSPGRWAPQDRFQCLLARKLMKALTEALDEQFDLLALACRMAHGGSTESPFPPSLIVRGREARLSALGVEVHTNVFAITPRQPILLNLLSLIARVLGDPDWRALCHGPENYTEGVSVGYMTKLPRTPAVYERKLRWRKYEPEDMIIEERANYSSVRVAIPVIRQQFDQEVQEGMMIKMDRAAAKTKSKDRLRIAPLGAQAKGDGSYRTLHDGTHGSAMNPFLKVRDQLRYPGGGVLRAVLAFPRSIAGPAFGLSADVSRAHRRFRHRESDWGLLACALEDDAA